MVRYCKATNSCTRGTLLTGLTFSRVIQDGCLPFKRHILFSRFRHHWIPLAILWFRCIHRLEPIEGGNVDAGFSYNRNIQPQSPNRKRAVAHRHQRYRAWWRPGSLNNYDVNTSIVIGNCLQLVLAILLSNMRLQVTWYLIVLCKLDSTLGKGLSHQVAQNTHKANIYISAQKSVN